MGANAGGAAHHLVARPAGATHPVCGTIVVGGTAGAHADATAHRSATLGPRARRSRCQRSAPPTAYRTGEPPYGALGAATARRADLRSALGHSISGKRGCAPWLERSTVPGRGFSCAGIARRRPGVCQGVE